MDDFFEGVRHAHVLPLVVAEGGALINQPGLGFLHPLGTRGAGQWEKGGGGGEVLQILEFIFMKG